MSCYEKSKRITLNEPTVDEVIKLLQTKNQQAKVYGCGDPQLVIHEAKDGSYISFDYDDLDEDYDE